MKAFLQQTLPLYLFFTKSAVGYFYTQPEPAPLNATAYNTFLSCVSMISGECWVAVEHGSVVIMPAEGGVIEEDAQELDRIDCCQEKAGRSLNVQVRGNWVDEMPMRRIEEASAEWAEEEGAEGVKRSEKRWRDDMEL